MPRSSPRAETTARRAALECLVRIERDAGWATPLLASREAALVDPRDAGLLHELVLGVLRRRRALDHVLECVSSRRLAAIDPEVRGALRIGVYSLLFLDRVPDHAAVDGSVSLVSRKAAGFVNAILRNVARSGASLLPPAPVPPDSEGLALACSYPTWWVRRQIDRLGWDAARALLEAGNRPAPTTLTHDPGRIDRAALLTELTAAGLEVERGRFTDGAIRVVTGRVAGCAALERGVAWVQDEAAQLVCRLFGDRIGPRAVDLCAAPGGKTSHLAARLDGPAILLALERNEARMRTLAASLARRRFDRVFIVRADAERPPAAPASFDQVLLDAPCSGSGTLGRHPELRWRLEQGDPRVKAAEQDRLLRAAARLTAPGGTLVYAVCSIEPEEGEDVVRRFVEAEPDFEIEDPRPYLPEAAHRLVTGERFLDTSLALGEIDGFFAARLRRKSG